MPLRSYRHRGTRGRGKRRGAALVTSLLIIIVLSAIAAGGFTMIEGERRSVTDHEAFGEAYNIARSGFDRFMASPTTMLPALTNLAWTGPDSAQVSFPNGYAWIMVQQVRPAVGGDQAIYLVRSRGVRTSYMSGKTPAAERMFAQYARMESASIPMTSAWTSLSGILKNGSSGTISGSDACGASTAVSGVAVPTVPGYTQTGVGTSVPTGSPPIADLGTPAAAVNAMSSIDWPGIVSGQTMTPDYVVPGSSWPSFTDPNFWPVIYVDQTTAWTLPTSGRGLLVVRHDLVMNGIQKWDGVVLVGGTLTSNGTNEVSGAIITGLNVTLGEIVPVNSIGNGTKTFVYNSCNVAKAMTHFNGFRSLRNTTVDNWPSY